MIIPEGADGKLGAMVHPRLRVAIAACRSRDGDGSDVYPDEDWPLLREALDAVGAEAVRLRWDTSGMDWASFDLVVISSTWDSVDRPREYLAWARATAGVTRLLNPVSVIEWNLDKTYLRRLHGRGVPVIPTQWVRSEAHWTPPPHEFVVKPSVSAGGRQTARYAADDGASATEHVLRLLASGKTVMVQPFLPSVEAEGEVKLVFIGGLLRHAFRVGPLLEAGAGVLERPWEKPVSMRPVTPTPAQVRTARAVLAAVQAEVSANLLYARVDLLAGSDGEPLLGEVELVDPALMLRLAPTSATFLAEAIREQAGAATK